MIPRYTLIKNKLQSFKNQGSIISLRQRMQNLVQKIVKLQLYITRHGETQQNSKRIICGQNPGKLTKQGIQQAQKIGDYFQNQSFHKIYVSDLGRTKQTFQNIVLKAPHLKNIETKYQSLIREKNGGILTGQPLSAWEKQAQKQKKPIREYKCKEGQSWVDVNKRVHQFIEKLVQQNVLQKQNPLPEQKILIVCHGGYIMEFHNACKTISSKGKQKATFSNSARNCSIHGFEMEYPINSTSKVYQEQHVSIKCVLNNFTGHMNK